MTKYILIELATGQVTKLDEWRQPIPQGRPVDVDKVLELVSLFNHNVRLTTANVADHLAITPQGALKRLHRLESMGYVQRDGRGKWMQGDLEYPSRA